MSTSFLRIAFTIMALAIAAEAAHAGAFQRQIAAESNGEVDISNVAGQIVINGWEQPQVSVTADLPGDTQRVRVTSGNGRTTVCITYGDSKGCNSPGGPGMHSPVRLELHVPRGSELDVSGVSAGITSRGVAGSQRLHTVSGDIDADLGTGNDEVTSVSGSISLHGSGQDGALRVTSVSGDLSVTRVAGELEARTVNGRLRAQLAPARRVRLNTTSGDIGLSARLTAGGTIETETVSGDQKLEVSAPAGYYYEAKTFSGNINDCFGRQPDKTGYGPGNRLNGTRGGGNGHVRIKSLSGGISLCDH